VDNEKAHAETPELLGRLYTPCTIKHFSFKVKRSKVKVTRLSNAETGDKRSSHQVD